MNERSLALLKLLINAKGFTTIASLAKSFNVSRRSIYNDIDRINDYLNKHYQTSITKIYGKGIYLADELKESLRSSSSDEMNPYYEFDRKERLRWIYLYISCDFEKAVFVDNLCNLLRVSRNTILNDLHGLKTELEPYNIAIDFDIKHGYSLSGDEVDIRNKIMSYSMQFPQIKTLSFINESYKNQFKTLISKYEQSINIQITDEYRDMLKLWFTLFTKRILQGHTVRLAKEEIDILRMTEEFSLLEAAVRTLDLPALNSHDNIELIYMTRFLLSAKVKSGVEHDTSSRVDDTLHLLIISMVNEFEKKAGVFFQEKDSLNKNLFFHLKPAFYRLRYGIHIKNPLKDEVKKKYNDIFKLTEQVVHHFQSFVKEQLTEDEITFIAIHFGGWLKRNDLSIENRKLKVMLVCTNGIGIARIMESQMARLLPDYEIVSVSSISEYNSKEDWSDLVDFTVTTNQLKNRGVPIIKVNPLFTKADMKELLSIGKVDQQLTGEYTLNDINTMIDIISHHADIINRQQLKEDLLKFTQEKNELPDTVKPSLESLLPVEHIQVKQHIESWKNAISTAAIPLLEEQSINENYINQMIKNVNNQGTYIMVADDIAMPHATYLDGVQKTGISILLLRHPVKMKERQVHLFIVLASVDNENHLRAIAELTRLLRNKETMAQLLTASDSETFHTILFQENGGVS